MDKIDEEPQAFDDDAMDPSPPQEETKDFKQEIMETFEKEVEEISLKAPAGGLIVTLNCSPDVVELCGNIFDTILEDYTGNCNEELKDSDGINKGEKLLFI